MADAKIYPDTTGPNASALGDETGQEIADQMNPAALAQAQSELDNLAPGPSEPLRFGNEGIKTQLDEDPISEVNPFQERLP